MTRESRLLLVIGVLAVLGVTSLAMIANRYRRLLTDAPEPGVTRSRAADLPVPSSSSDPVTRFAAVRREVVSAVEAHAPGSPTVVDPATGRLRPELTEIVRRIADRKLNMLAQVGMTGKEYDRIRLAYLAWLRGGDGVDDALRGSFEARKALLEGLELGALEDLDVPTAP